MTYIKEKAEFNKSSADLLYKHSFYASSVHCAYYSCFQLLKYIIKSKLKVDYDAQESEIIQSRPPIKSHAYVTKKILDKIQTLEKDPLEYRKIRTHLKELQLLRVNSDYKNIQIDQAKSRQAIDYSSELNTYFKKKLL